jgi:hypothetical protein
LAVGVTVRLALGGAGVGERSAVLLAVLLTIGLWLAAWVIAGPRAALLATLACMALFDLAALPVRNPPAYDDLQAVYRTDQVLSARVPVVDQNATTTLLLVAQPVFSGPQPAFGLAGEVNGVALQWNCAFRHGIQTLALPLPTETLRGVTPLDVQLQLTGSPSRESDYLLAYQSSRQGGLLTRIAADPPVDPTRCALT